MSPRKSSHRRLAHVNADLNFEIHQNFERQLPRRLWRRNRVRLASVGELGSDRGERLIAKV